MTIIAILGLLILAGLTLFQLFLITGKPWGIYAWGGQHKILPAKLRIASGFSIVLYAIFAAFLLSKAGIVSIITSESVLATGLWILTFYFTLGILMNAMSRSKQERMVMTPVALVLAAVFLAAASL